MVFNQALLIEPSYAEVIADYLNHRLYGHAPQALNYTTLQALDMESDRPQHRDEQGKPFIQVGPIAVIEVLGETVQRKGGMDALSGLCSYQAITKSHRAAMRDPDIRGIMIVDDSPGGAVAGLKVCGDEIVAGSMRNGGKPHLAFIDERAFSAAYWLASCCDWIVAPDHGMAGSIGACMLMVDQSKMLEEVGIKPIMLRSHHRKNRGNGLEPIDDETISRHQKLIDDIGHEFCGFVSDQRRVPLDIIEGTQADIFSAPEALALGLIDQIGTQDDALEALLGLI